LLQPVSEGFKEFSEEFSERVLILAESEGIKVFFEISSEGMSIFFGNVAGE